MINNATNARTIATHGSRRFDELVGRLNAEVRTHRTSWNGTVAAGLEAAAHALVDPKNWKIAD